MNIPFYPDLSELRANIPNTEIAVTQPVAFIPPPPLSEWTWANQGLTVAEDVPGGIRFTATANDTGTVTVLGRDLPDAPYTITMVFNANITFDSVNYGLLLFNSVTLLSKLFLTVNSFPSIYPIIQYFDDFDTHNGGTTSFNPAAAGFWTTASDALWLRICNDGTYITYSLSFDGEIFLQVSIVSKNEFTNTEDSFGIVCIPQSTNPTYDESYVVTLLSLDVTTP